MIKKCNWNKLSELPETKMKYSRTGWMRFFPAHTRSMVFSLYPPLSWLLIENTYPYQSLVVQRVRGVWNFGPRPWSMTELWTMPCTVQARVRKEELVVEVDDYIFVWGKYRYNHNITLPSAVKFRWLNRRASTKFNPARDRPLSWGCHFEGEVAFVF